MCKKCSVNNSNCGCGLSSTYNTSNILFDGQDFICPSNFTLNSGEPLSELIGTLAVGICTNAALLPNPGDKGPVGEQGIQGIQGVAGNTNGGFVYEHYATYPTNEIVNV